MDGIEDVKKTEEELRQEAIKTAEKANGDWDKERQRADQEAANVRRLVTERNQLTSQLASLQTQVSQQQAEIQKLSSTKQVLDEIPEVKTDEADPETLAKAVNAAKKIIASQAEKLTRLENKATQYEQIETSRSAQSQRNAILERICVKLESEFGAGLRNDAIALMEQINKEEGDPDDAADATLRFRDCFKKAKEARDAKKKQTDKSPIPPGEGGGKSSFNKLQFKRGISLKEAVAQAGQMVGAGKS